MPLLRPFIWLFIRLLYRFRVYGREHVPASGGCLIVCNRVSLLDRLVLRAACPRSLTIAPDRDGNVEAIAAAFDRGDAVLIFPEGHLTRSGHMLPFGPQLAAELRTSTGRADLPFYLSAAVLAATVALSRVVRRPG